MFHSIGVHEYGRLFEVGRFPYLFIEIHFQLLGGESLVGGLFGGAVEGFDQCFGEGTVAPGGVFV